MSDKPVRRMTVSEFIRTSKPDWEHVRTRDKRASTGGFTGATVVSMGNLGETYEEQVDVQDRQRVGMDEPDALWGEEIQFVDDTD